MPSYNLTVVCGHLGADPESRDVGNTSVTRLRLAVDDSYKSKSGEKVDRTVWVEVEAWDKLGEVCQRFLTKGSPVLVEGKLQMDEWEDSETGKKRSKLKIRATRVEFLGKRGDGGAQAQEPTAAPVKDKDGDEIPF